MKLSNIAWNLAGLSTPLLVAVTTIPAIIQAIGMERFGLLALAWGLIGYSGIFDLGIGRATTQLVAQLRGQNADDEIPLVIRKATQLTLLTGVVGFICLTLAAMFGAHKLINYSSALEREIEISVYMLAFIIPVQAISATYRGVNEAFENFRGVSLVRMMLGGVNFFGPYIVARYTSSLPWLISSLLVSRLAALSIFRYLAMRCVRNNLGLQPTLSSVAEETLIKRRLFAFGGWFTLSSIVSPLLVQADRFVIAGVISATAVATYTIPYEIVVQSLVIVGAVSSVAFPSITKLIHEQPDKWQNIFHRWLIIVALIMFSVLSMLALLLPVILPYWIGKDLPDESILIGQILCVGVFANSIGSMYFSVLHAKGRPDLTAKLHLVELPLFITALYSLIGVYGLYGAAWAWAGRMIFDAVLLKFLCRNHYA